MAKKAEIKRDLTNSYTVRQTAQLLGLTVKRVRQLLNEGKLTRVATDPIILIDQIEVIEFRKVREADPRKSPAYSTYNKKTELDKWAGVLGVNAPAIIFQGKLNDEQKVKFCFAILKQLQVLSNKK